MNLLIVSIIFQITISLTQEKKLTLWAPEIQDQFLSLRDINISNDGLEAYFTADDLHYRMASIISVKKVAGQWVDPQVVSFSGHYRDIEPFLSPDGQRLFFASNRPLPADQEEPSDYNIWFVQRESASSSWSEPVALDTLINTEGNEYYPAITSNGNLFFTSERKGGQGKEDIFVSRFTTDGYSMPKSVSGGVNSPFYEFNAYVAPDESFMIYTSQREGEGQGGGDLYMSVKKDDEWGTAKLLDAFNSNTLDYCPFVDISNGQIYLTSRRNGTPNYSAKPVTAEYWKNKRSSAENGLSRIYVAKLEF